MLKKKFFNSKFLKLKTDKMNEQVIENIKIHGNEDYKKYVQEQEEEHKKAKEEEEEKRNVCIICIGKNIYSHSYNRKKSTRRY